MERLSVTGAGGWWGAATRRHAPPPPGVWPLLAGVALPAVTLGVELLTRLCARHLFDPVPTVWHLALVALVPAANWWVWSAARRVEAPEDPRRRRLGWANGFALGVSLFYAILLLPTLPLAVAALIVGLGLLPLAPLLAAASALLLRRRLRGLGARLPGLWGGMAFALLALAAVELPETAVRVGLRLATSESPDDSRRGVAWLRAIEMEESLRRACYRQPGRATDVLGLLVSWGDPVSPGAAQHIYYRVTGQPFNALPRPGWSVTDAFDGDRGGETVGGRLDGLALVNSRIDGSVDPQAALGYLEWTMVFKNTTPWQQEARARVALPPGGVVSRLTLWVNGEEREAAFAARGRVREAYRQIVSQRRDPVLVTTDGPDQILVQCFPVPADGGEMKIRLGITAPVALESLGEGWLRLPGLAEVNFAAGREARHSVWVESKGPLDFTGKGLSREQPHPWLFAVRGDLSDSELNQHFPAIRVRRPADVASVWARDPQSQIGEIITQQLEVVEAERAPRLILVVDGSRGMTNFIPEIAEALESLPSGIEVSALVAADEIVEVAPGPGGMKASYRRLGESLRTIRYQGGQDSIPVLARAWDLAAQSPGGAVLWIHEPVPLLLSGAEELRQRFERRTFGPRLYDLPTRPGPNRVAEALDGLEAVTAVARRGRLGRDLARFVSRRGDGARQVIFRREKTLSPAVTAPETSAHLARLWARGEVSKLIESRETGATDQAIKLAAGYQLVTPVSGAVVLERAEQYQRAGLEPVSPGTVPTIPEPELWLLLAVASALLASLSRRGRHACRPA